MRVALIVPTRGRPDKALELSRVIDETSTTTDLIFGLDDDDPELLNYIEAVGHNTFDVAPRGGMNATLNNIARRAAWAYDFLAFMGDDHRPRTRNWDGLLIESISDFNYGIAYGNDLIQGENLPTAVLMDSRIVRKLGFMAPPEQRHLYLDDFWRDLGKSLGTLRYNPQVIIEHMHFSVGKSEQDALYAEVNSNDMYDHDRVAYEKYRAEQFDADVDKILGRS